MDFTLPDDFNDVFDHRMFSGWVSDVVYNYVNLAVSTDFRKPDCIEETVHALGYLSQMLRLSPKDIANHFCIRV